MSADEPTCKCSECGRKFISFGTPRCWKCDADYRRSERLTKQIEAETAIVAATRKRRAA